MMNLARGVRFGAIAAIVFIGDFLSKCLTHSFIPLMDQSSAWYPYGGIGIFRNLLGIEFSISHTTNTGAAWGWFAGAPAVLLTFRVVLVLVLGVYFLFINRSRSWDLPLTLILTGAIANIADFLIYGHVVDMLHFVLWGYDYPVFNVADSAICVGIFWLLLLSLFKQENATQPLEKAT